MALLRGRGVLGFLVFSYAISCRFVIGCLFSSCLLWSNIICAYCMAIMLICLNVFLIFMVGSLSFASSSFIDWM